MAADGSRQPDLLAWTDIQEAEQRCAAAAEAWALARRRFRLAPHGLRQSRLTALQEAAQEALNADLHLARLRRGLS